LPWPPLVSLLPFKQRHDDGLHWQTTGVICKGRRGYAERT
jgi:hypothetical protein